MSGASIKGGLLGALTAVVIVALNVLGNMLAGLQQIQFVIFDWIARILPGNLITFAIDTMVSVITRLNLGPTSTVAKLVEQGIAVVQFLLLGAVFGVILAILGRRKPSELTRFGAIGGLLISIVVIGFMYSLGFPAADPLPSSIWVVFVLVTWGSVLGKINEILIFGVAEPPGNLSRRQFLYLVGLGSFTILISAAGISILSDEEAETALIPETGQLVSAETTSGPAQSPTRQELANRIEAVSGTRPELTSNENFYRIDINTITPRVDEAQWRLEIDGLVRNPLSLSLDEIRARPAVSQAITLECISNQLGGDLISTSLWTGVRLKDILAEAGLQEPAREVFIESVDGFYESVPMSDVEDDRTLLIYAMNGEPLPAEHGFPLRIYIPNRFGMKQPKWITRMEVTDQARPGYWVDRGWSKEAIPPTTSVIDTVGSAEGSGNGVPDGFLPVGGIAYAGARGISRVEVQVDDGPWQEAELRTPPLSPLTWVQWRYEWESQPGRHSFRVRAYDGSGTLQEVEPSEPHPDGATGIHSVEELT